MALKMSFMVEGKQVNIADAIYPVGAIYITTSTVNPATYLGGTWERYANGRCLVGVNEGDGDFNSVNKAGGNKYLQNHGHTMSNANLQGRVSFRDVTGGAHDTVLGSSGVFSNKKERWSGTHTALGGVNLSDYYYNNVYFNANHNHSVANTGSGNSQNLQPYIAVYIWRRTA